jgi:hypothetical protein
MNAAELRTFLCERFNETELRTLVFDLKIPFEDLGGAEIGKEGRIQALIEWCVRRGRINELSQAAYRARGIPDSTLPNIVPAATMNDWGLTAQQFDRVMRQMDSLREDVAALVTKVEVGNQRLASIERRLDALEGHAQPVSWQTWAIAVVGLIMAVVMGLVLLQLVLGGHP